MKRCTKCLMPETAPNIEFNDDGVCLACQRAENKIDRESRLNELDIICKAYRKNDNNYDCIIPVSGGKDSFFQVYWMKIKMGMNPLLVSVTDEWEHTKAGIHNNHRICEAFRCDCITLRLNPQMVKETTRWGFEETGSTNWAVDSAIYAWPLQMAIKLGIKLVVYGENVAWEYGHKIGVDTYSAKEQIKNTVVNIDCIPPIWGNEKNCIKYPAPEEIDGIDSIYLSYFTGWDGTENLKIAKEYGFRTLEYEWDRAGYIDDFWQIDSVGYLCNYYLKYAKYGYSKATDVASHLIRYGHIARDKAIEIVRKKEGQIDKKVVDDFIRFTGYNLTEFNIILEKWFNKELFNEKRTLKNEHKL